MSIPTVSRLLPPTSYTFCGGSLGQAPVHVLWPAVTHEHGGMTSGWWFFYRFVLFPFQWWVRPESVFFGSEQEIPEDCRILAVVTYLWSLQVYEPEKSKVSGGCLSAVATPEEEICGISVSVPPWE